MMGGVRKPGDAEPGQVAPTPETHEATATPPTMGSGRDEDGSEATGKPTGVRTGSPVVG